jgi:hypothetical protein
MKQTSVTVLLPLFVLLSGSCLADACYTVEGEAKTVNVPEATQFGSIKLLLLDENDDEAFNERGDLIGTVTGANLMLTYLSHTASFEDDSKFISNDDEARIVGVRKFEEDGTPCSFYIHEVIRHIAKGEGFFEQVKEVQIDADGYVSNCIDENENEFELSGRLCID